MRYFTTVHEYDKTIIKEFDSLEELNDYYGFHFKETDKFPALKENVMGIYTYMIINKL